jgi:hypothetical protein
MKRLLIASVLASFLFFLFKRDVVDLSLARQIMNSVSGSEDVLIVSDVPKYHTSTGSEQSAQNQKNYQSRSYVTAALSEFSANDLASTQEVLSYLELMTIMNKLSEQEKGCSSAVARLNLSDVRAKVSLLSSNGFFLPEEIVFINQLIESKSECFLPS